MLQNVTFVQTLLKIKVNLEGKGAGFCIKMEVRINLNATHVKNLFLNKEKFLLHRKKYHTESVETCKNFEAGNKYGYEKCWFNHGDSENGTEDINYKKMDTDVTEKNISNDGKIYKQLVEMKATNNLK